MALPFRDDLPTRRVSWLTMVLIGVNLAVFLLLQPASFQDPAGFFDESTSYLEVAESEEFVMRWAAVPCEVTTGELVADRPDGCDDPPTRSLPDEKSIVLSLLTAMFLHGDVVHLAGNLLFLWAFGNNVEDRMGRGSYLLLYLLGGLAATLTFVAVQPESAVPMLGASGAIAAVMGAYLVFYPRARFLTAVSVGPQLVYLPALAVLSLYFATQFLTSDDGIAWEAHAGGMVAGAVLALVMGRLPWIRARARTDVDVGLRRPAPSSF